MAGAGARGHVFEASVPQVAIEQLRLAGTTMCSFRVGDLRVDVAVRDEDVLPAVVVEVEEADAEAHVLRG